VIALAKEVKMIDIKVVGPGCKNCVELEKRVKRVVEEMQIEATSPKLAILLK